MKQYRQGDVFLFQVDSLPKGATPVPLDGNRLVLAYGEVTGHAHAIYDHLDVSARADEITDALMERCKARLYEHKGERYLLVKEQVALKHEEHETHLLAPGVYELPIQVEFSVENIRRVAD